jgi:hypothetical protein
MTNMLQVPAFKVLLNDLSSAHWISLKGVPFSGCMQHAPDRILQALIDGQNYVPLCQDDLVMLVRMGFLCIWPIHLRAEPLSLLQFWLDVHSSYSFYRRGLLCMNEADPYHALKTWIAELPLPEHFNFASGEQFQSLVQPDIIDIAMQSSSSATASAAPSSSSLSMIIEEDVQIHFYHNNKRAGKYHQAQSCSGTTFSSIICTTLSHARKLGKLCKVCFHD